MNIISKKRVMLFTLIAVLVVARFSWIEWTKGKIIARSVSPSGHKEIIVRAVPFTKNPFYMFLPLHSRFYRCEYYWVQNDLLRSSQSFSEDSYIAGNIQIEWVSAREAIVSFDDVFTLGLDDGFWSRKQMIKGKPQW